jgi:hypothetical protein
LPRGHLLAASGHYEIEPDEGQPAHCLVSPPQPANVAAHNDRFESLVVRVELVIDPAAAMRSENVRVADQDGHAAAVSSDCRRLVVHTVLDPRIFLSHTTQGAAMRASMRDEMYKTARPILLGRRSLPCFAGSKE